MSTYVKKEDGTLIESDTEVIKVETNNIKKLLDITQSCQYFIYLGYPAFRRVNLIGIMSYNDTENVTNMSHMFYVERGYDNYLTGLPLLNTSKVTEMIEMFGRVTFRTTIPKFDTSQVVNMGWMFTQAKNLLEVPTFNTSNVKIASAMFYQCDRLTIIPAFDFSNVTSISDAFYGCTNLEQFLPTGLKVSFDLSTSTKFTREALVVVLNNLGTPTSTQTLTLGSTNLSKLTEEDIAIATDKNWTLK